MKSIHQTGALAAMLLSGGAVVHAGSATVLAADMTTAAHASSVHAGPTDAPSGMAPVVVVRGSDDLFHVRVRLDGREASAVFDTGASRTVISGSMARQLGLSRLDPGEGPDSRMQTLGGHVPFRARHVEHLHVEGMALGPIDLAEIDGLDVPLILGQDAISRFRAVEIRNRRLTLR